MWGVNDSIKSKQLVLVSCDALVIQSINFICYLIGNGLCYFLFSISQIFKVSHVKAENLALQLDYTNVTVSRLGKWEMLRERGAKSSHWFISAFVFVLSNLDENDLCLNMLTSFLI